MMRWLFKEGKYLKLLNELKKDKLKELIFCRYANLIKVFVKYPRRNLFIKK